MIVIIAIVILIYLLKVTPETQAAELLYQLNHQLKIDLVENRKYKNPGNLAVCRFVLCFDGQSWSHSATVVLMGKKKRS